MEFLSGLERCARAPIVLLAVCSKAALLAALLLHCLRRRATQRGGSSRDVLARFRIITRQLLARPAKALRKKERVRESCGRERGGRAGVMLCFCVCFELIYTKRLSNRLLNWRSFG